MASRGEVWQVDLSPTVGHEQRGRRPALIVSTDVYNHGPAGLVVVLPITTTNRRIPIHIEVQPPGGGLTQVSYIMCDQIRSISSDRLAQRLGVVGQRTLAHVQDRLSILLEL